MDPEFLRRAVDDMEGRTDTAHFERSPSRGRLRAWLARISRLICDLVVGLVHIVHPQRESHVALASTPKLVVKASTR
jgi:hypothetical protein